VFWCILVFSLCAIATVALNETYLETLDLENSTAYIGWNGLEIILRYLTFVIFPFVNF